MRLRGCMWYANTFHGPSMTSSRSYLAASLCSLLPVTPVRDVITLVFLNRRGHDIIPNRVDTTMARTRSTCRQNRIYENNNG